jgi:mono/diheme cytochrome c family protein
VPTEAPLRIIAASQEINTLSGEFMFKASTAAILMFVLTCLIHSSQAQSSPASKNSAAAKAGQQLFVQKCFQCHSVNEGEVRFGPSLYHVMKGSHAKSATDIRGYLKNGKGKMPPIGATLTKEETDSILAYLHSL